MTPVMGKHHATALVLVPFLFSLGVGCGSDSGNGGACQNLTGTYQDTSTTCPPIGNTKVVQTGCNATITTGQGDLTGTVSGNHFTSPDVSCTVAIAGTSYTTDCTQKDAMGNPVTCHSTGTVSDRPVQGGAGGTGNIGSGGSGNLGAGGMNTGSGGTPGSTATCGVTWSPNASCNDCMSSSCCAELQNCVDGTPCGTFLNCVLTKCPSGDAACLQSQCSTELQAASADVSALSDCNTQKCQGCQ
jgi:hypothetical protein